ncbi:MAG: mechanosensitive ion channel domain-containing protein [Pirellulaceae bacterium]
MDALVRRLSYWLLVSGLVLFFADGSCYAAPQQVAQAVGSEEKGGEENESEPEVVEEVVRSMVSMASLRDYSYSALKGILILASFWLAGAIAFGIICRIGRARHVDKGLAEFLGRVVKVAALIVGAITALSEMGIDVRALITGLGLTGFAFGFAFKDIISNVLAGVLIIIYKPFQVGDQIKIKAYAGNVISIDLRYTVLNTDGDMVYVPNSLLFTDAIIVKNTAPVTETAPVEG